MWRVDAVAACFQQTDTMDVGVQVGSKQLSIRNTRTLQMADDVLCVRLSPDARYIAVALLDSTIKVVDGGFGSLDGNGMCLSMG